MTKPRAYEEIALSHGDITVRLRPSLRAASLLEAEHNGLESLFRGIDEFKLSTIRQIITATATRSDADALMKAVAKTPLGEVQKGFHGPLTSLCLGFIPQVSQSEPQHSKPVKSATCIAWAEVYQRLYRAATGWLLWTPEAAWSATPTEIAQAFEEHLEMLKTIHGSADAEAEAKEVSQEQQARNIAEGLDPEFDRDALRSLKAKLGGGIA